MVCANQSTLRRFVSNLSISRHIASKTDGFTFLESDTYAHSLDENRNQLVNFKSLAFCELEASPYN